MKWVLLALLVALHSASAAVERYVVATTAAEGDAWDRVANEIARFRSAEAVVRFDPARLDSLERELEHVRPRYVCVVLPKETLDVRFARWFLRMATRLDEDPFVDFSYGFITGADAEQAMAFVGNIQKKEKEGVRTRRIASCAICGNDGSNAFGWLAPEGYTHTCMSVGADDPGREAFLQDNVGKLGGNDLIHFTGHGGPEGVSEGYSAKMLNASDVDLFPAVVVSCACYTAVVHRCFFTDPSGAVREYICPTGESFALSLIRRGVTGYFAGVDGWHGLLSHRVFDTLLYEGATCGDAARQLQDRMVLQWRAEGFDTDKLLEEKDDDRTLHLVTQVNMVFLGDPATRVREPRRDRVSCTVGERIRVRVSYEPGEANWAVYGYYTCKDFGPKGEKEMWLSVPLPSAVQAAGLSVKQANLKEARDAKLLWAIDRRGRQDVLLAAVVFPGDAGGIVEQLNEEGLFLVLAATRR